MNVAAYQKKEKNEKTGKRKTGEERRQADFKEAACYPSAVVQGLHGEKMVCVRGVPGVTGTRFREPKLPPNFSSQKASSENRTYRRTY